jgi:hypothetical protein
VQRQCQEESAKIAEKSGNGFANSAFSAVIILTTFNKDTIVPQLRDDIVTILIRKVLIVNSASGHGLLQTQRGCTTARTGFRTRPLPSVVSSTAKLWITTASPSLQSCPSSLIPSAPISAANRKAAMVFSGAE